MDSWGLPKEDRYKILKRKEMQMIEKTEYKGKPVLVIKRDENDKYPFSFGLSKARLILDNIDEIKKFVAENSQEE
jgi:uncharacterized protein YgiM (DUF1202 family)